MDDTGTGRFSINQKKRGVRSLPAGSERCDNDAETDRPFNPSRQGTRAGRTRHVFSPQITRIGTDRDLALSVPRGESERNARKEITRGTRKHAGLAGNAGRPGSCDTINEIIHHSVRRTSRRRHLRAGAGRSRNTRAWWHIFFSFSHSLPLSLSLSLSLSPASVRAASPDRSAALSPRVSRYRGPIRAISGFSAARKVNERTGLAGLPDSALRSERSRIMDRTDRTRAPRFAPLPSAFRPDLAPNPGDSILSSLLRRDLRPLRFNLTRHYYVFHRDSSLVKFRSHNPDSSSFLSCSLPSRVQGRGLVRYVYLRYRAATFQARPCTTARQSLYKNPESNIPPYFRSIIDEPWRACKGGRLPRVGVGNVETGDTRASDHR